MPQGAPNIIVILLDDVGFAATSTFGGVAATPTLDRLAAEGLRCNSFHVTPMCAPTRAALLSGRNSHQVGFGRIPELQQRIGLLRIWGDQSDLRRAVQSAAVVLEAHRPRLGAAASQIQQVVHNEAVQPGSELALSAKGRQLGDELEEISCVASSASCGWSTIRTAML